MGVAQTSILAYETIKSRLGRRQQQVYETIQKLEPCHNLQIAEYLGLPINQITGRVNELDKMGMISSHIKAKNGGGIKVKYWVSRDLNDEALKKITKETSRFDRDGVRV
jgi:DNA-binding MarR family transcriptional regulator